MGDLRRIGGSKLLTLLVFACAVSTPVCEARSHDYTFSVTGVITDEDGTPIQNAEVTLEVNGPVYRGVTPVKTEQIVTNTTGGFVIMHISHKLNVKYTIRVRKDGFEPQTVSGSAPPDGHHTIRLKKTE